MSDVLDNDEMMDYCITKIQFIVQKQREDLLSYIMANSQNHDKIFITSQKGTYVVLDELSQHVLQLLYVKIKEFIDSTE